MFLSAWLYLASGMGLPIVRLGEVWPGPEAGGLYVADFRGDVFWDSVWTAVCVELDLHEWPAKCRIIAYALHFLNLSGSPGPS